VVSFCRQFIVVPSFDLGRLASLPGLVGFMGWWKWSSWRGCQTLAGGATRTTEPKEQRRICPSLKGSNSQGLAADRSMASLGFILSNLLKSAFHRKGDFIDKIFTGSYFCNPQNAEASNLI
jgi:hypothetical protein